MAWIYLNVYIISRFIFMFHVSDGGICYTKMESSMCYNDPSNFAADSGRSCCQHYDAVGFTSSNHPESTNLCQPCANFLEEDAVVCYTKSSENLCWGKKPFKMVSPRACCENNQLGGFSKVHSLSTISPRDGELYECTLCATLKPPDWSEWSATSDCNVTCGLGVRRRTRSCLIPPQIGLCVGTDVDYQLCDRGPCGTRESENLINKWTEWTAVSFCNVTCGKGFRIRKRYCLSQENYRCFGTDVDHEECFGHECPTDKIVLILLIIVVVSFAIAIAAVILIRFLWKRRQKKFHRAQQNFELTDEGYVNEGLTSDF